MRSLLRRYRELVFVAFLLALPFAILVVRGRKPTQLNPLDRVVLALAAPAEKFIVWSVGCVTDTWNEYLWLRGVHRENEELRRRLLRQQSEVAHSTELENENGRLRALLDFSDKLGATRLLAAQVVAVGASPHSHALRISRGSADGVVRGMAVISPDGVVGTVVQVTPSYSDVQLIVSPLSAVPAIGQRTRGRSTVKGTGDLTRCKLEYALRTDDLQDGDWLVTAGGENSFPKGLRIGRVTGVQKRATGMFLAADVLPAVEFSKLDEVLVVLHTEEPVTPPAASAAPPPVGLPVQAGVRP